MAIKANFKLYEVGDNEKNIAPPTRLSDKKHITPQAYIEYRDRLQKEIDMLEDLIEFAHEKAQRCPRPSSTLRPIDNRLAVGDVVWDIESVGGHLQLWKIVDGLQYDKRGDVVGFVSGSSFCDIKYYGVEQ